MKVIIGVDPHKGSHTAVAVDDSEAGLARVKVRTSGSPLDQPRVGVPEPGLGCLDVHPVQDHPQLRNAFISWFETWPAVDPLPQAETGQSGD